MGFNEDQLEKIQGRWASSSRIERLAGKIVKDRFLAGEQWQDEDWRRDTLYIILKEEAMAAGLNEAQEEYLGRLLDDLASSQIGPIEGGKRLVGNGFPPVATPMPPKEHRYVQKPIIQ